jgi:hypothetical protein
MKRVPILTQVAAILESAPLHEPSRLPQSFRHRDLACQVYGTEEPTAAQLSAVRRAVARLVGDGRALRLPDRRWGEGTGTHLRRSRDGSRSYTYSNPTGVQVRRVMTDADREARAVVAARIRARHGLDGDVVIERR